MSLDEDDDPVRLFAALSAALEPHDLPWRSAPAALAASEAAHGVIVFDDLHRVQLPEVHAFLDALIERLPPQWTVVISSRIAPRLALARWRAADELAEFTQESLRFSVDEARTLAALEKLPGLDERLPELMARTQGWPAGLRLCFAALRGASHALLKAGRASEAAAPLARALASEAAAPRPVPRRWRRPRWPRQNPPAP